MSPILVYSRMSLRGYFLELDQRLMGRGREKSTVDFYFEMPYEVFRRTE